MPQAPQIAIWIAICTLALVVFVLIATGAHAATFKCRGFAFGYAELTCETTEPAIRAASFCDVMNRQGGAVMWSRSDTYDTKARADLINAAGKRLCGWGRK